MAKELSLRNLAEMFSLRSFQFTHEAVWDWGRRFAPLLAEQLRRRRKGKQAAAGTEDGDFEISGGEGIGVSGG